MHEIWKIGTEIWFRMDKKCVQTEWTDRCMHAQTTPKLYLFDFVGG